MAIYLDAPEKEYLLKTLKSFKSTYWVVSKIIDKIEKENERLQTISQCTHTSQSFHGTKTCCASCGAFYDPGMGESWTSDVLDNSGAGSEPGIFPKGSTPKDALRTTLIPND